MVDDDEHSPPVGVTASTTSHTSSPSTLTMSPATQSSPQPLRTIWDCVMINQVTVDEKRGWQCLWCNRTFIPEHATRALNHVLKVSKAGVKTCTARIEDVYLQRYQQLKAELSERVEVRKRSAIEVENSVVEHQERATEHLLTGRGVTIPARSVVAHSVVTASTNVSHRSTMGSGMGVGIVTRAPSSSSSSTTLLSRLVGVQPSISAAFENTTDIRKCNDASLEFALADFFHCENIPDQVVESDTLARVIKKARLVGSDFKMPSRSKIGGELLDLNFQTVYNSNKESLLKEAAVFGLAFLGDGATIKRMPLINILGMCAGTPPITISIQDCTDHMSEGGKKDATYIASLFEDKVEEYDPAGLYADVVFFDGAKNVQKGGEILTAKFPRMYCFHGGEHVVSLFFSSIAKIQPIKVRGYFTYRRLSNHILSNTTLLLLPRS